MSMPSSSPPYYSPNATLINNLTFVINGTGTNGIYNSSHTPDNQYGIYNWCNMPHVRSREYPVPSSEYTLEYVEVMHRHHKRTPYASNTFFKEDVGWNCVGEGTLHYGKNATGVASKVSPISWQGYTDPSNSFTNTVGPGFVNSTCAFPQITAEGLEDSHQHGLDLASVYGGVLGFLPLSYTSKEVAFRVSNNEITSQVLGALLTGLYPTSQLGEYAALVQSETYDSLEPTYSCPTASTIRNNILGTNPLRQEHLTAARSLYSKLDSVSGIPFNDTAGWHVSFDHYYDNLSAKQCHGKQLSCSLNNTATCVTQKDANEVYRLGQYEYSYMYRDAHQSNNYSRLHYGAFMLELLAHLKGKLDGSFSRKYTHNVCHDGSISPLLGLLQIDVMVWPGMGSEVIFEMWEKAGSRFIRVLWGGQVMRSSSSLGLLDMIPINQFIAYIEQYVPSDLVSACNA